MGEAIFRLLFRKLSSHGCRRMTARVRAKARGIPNFDFQVQSRSRVAWLADLGPI